MGFFIWKSCNPMKQTQKSDRHIVTYYKYLPLNHVNQALLLLHCTISDKKSIIRIGGLKQKSKYPSRSKLIFKDLTF